MPDSLKALVLGAAAGFVGGLFGVGGGVIAVPGLVLWLSARQHEAHGTSVAAIVAVSAAAATRFAIDGAVDWPTVPLLFLGAGVGALLGARLMGKLSPVWLARAFVVFAFASAVRLLLP